MSRMPRCRLTVLAVCLVASPVGAARTAVVLPPVDPGPASYTSPQLSTMRLSDDGRVATSTSFYFCQGNSCSGRNRVTVWDGGSWVDIGTLGGATSEFGGLAAGGVVVGGSQRADSTFGAFLWNGAMTELPKPAGWDFVFARAVNTGGTVAGWLVAGSGAESAVLWQNGVPTLLPLVRPRGYPVAIDDDGGVLLNEIDDTQDQCESLRLWTPGGTTTLVPTRCGFDADEARLSRHGVAVATIDGRVVRFVPGGTVDMDPAQVVSYYDRLWDVTDTGLALAAGMVPVSSPAGAFDHRSFLLTGDTSIDLKANWPVPGGGQITVALDMNERGQLLALVDSERLVLLTPVCGDGPDIGQPCDDGNTVDTDACRSDCTPNVCGDGVVRTGVEACDDAGAAGGCTEVCALPPDSVSTIVPPGGSTTTDDGVPGATPGDPVETTVTSPTGGLVTISETGAPTPPPAGYVVVGTVIDIAAPAATVENPLVLEFVLDASILPTGESVAILALFRNGGLVPECPGGLGGGAVPSPCVGLRETLSGGDVRIVALTAAASQWAIGVGSTCGDGTVDQGEQCDPGADLAGDCCTSDCALAPRDTSCRPTAGSCDVAETCNGTLPGCPADVRLPDVDADGECDGGDACIGGGTVVGGKLKLAKLGGAAGDEKVSFKGSAALTSLIDPAAHGVRLLVRPPGGEVILDVSVPSGVFDTATKSGWIVKAEAWKYRGRGAISKVKLARKAGILAVAVSGRAVTAAAPSGAALDAVLQLDPSAGSAGACLEATFPACRVKVSGAALSCK